MITRNKILFVVAVLLVAGATLFTSRGRVVNPEVSQFDVDVSDVATKSEEDTSIECSGEPTVSSTEGPYYKPGSPETKDITSGVDENAVTLEGFVLDTDCQPIAGAWIDFWQADGSGNYDLQGYNFRGHQYTDENGMYSLKTIVPSGYSGRTPHIHVKVRANEKSPVLTTQLYFPGEERNQTDSIFKNSLIVKIEESEKENANFDFILEAEEY